MSTSLANSYLPCHYKSSFETTSQQQLLDVSCNQPGTSGDHTRNRTYDCREGKKHKTLHQSQAKGKLAKSEDDLDKELNNGFHSEACVVSGKENGDCMMSMLDVFLKLSSRGAEFGFGRVCIFITLLFVLVSQTFVFVRLCYLLKIALVMKMNECCEIVTECSSSVWWLSYHNGTGSKGKQNYGTEFVVSSLMISIWNKFNPPPKKNILMKSIIQVIDKWTLLIQGLVYIWIQSIITKKGPVGGGGTQILRHAGMCRSNGSLFDK